MQKIEVIEKSTGARMSHTTGEPMGTTLFKTPEEAQLWMKKNDLSPTEYTIKILEG